MTRIWRLATPAAVALALCIAATALPAAARDFVQDQAGMFSASTVSALDSRIGAFNAQTHKEIVVVTAPSLNGQSLQAAAESAASSQQVNGVLIYIAKNDRKDIIVPDRAGVQAGWFSVQNLQPIEASMRAQFKDGDFDGGITSAVGSILGIYRSHLSSMPGSAPAAAPAATGSGFGGFHLSMFWWIVIIIVGFLVLRSIFRSFSGPRYMGGPVPPGGAPPAGYGPGYGPGYGYGGYGGGGSFWSGLLGGLGGAWLGNEMFGQHGGVMGSPADAAQTGGGTVDTSGGGWQSDPGQADLSGSSSGDWGGGGFGDSGGSFSGGDSGGGGDVGGSW